MISPHVFNLELSTTSLNTIQMRIAELEKMLGQLHAGKHFSKP